MNARTRGYRGLVSPSLIAAAETATATAAAAVTEIGTGTSTGTVTSNVADLSALIALLTAVPTRTRVSLWAITRLGRR